MAELVLCQSPTWEKGTFFLLECIGSVATFRDSKSTSEHTTMQCCGGGTAAAAGGIYSQSFELHFILAQCNVSFSDEA